MKVESVLVTPFGLKDGGEEVEWSTVALRSVDHNGRKIPETLCVKLGDSEWWPVSIIIADAYHSIGKPNPHSIVFKEGL